MAEETPDWKNKKLKGGVNPEEGKVTTPEDPDWKNKKLRESQLNEKKLDRNDPNYKLKSWSRESSEVHSESSVTETTEETVVATKTLRTTVNVPPPPEPEPEPEPEEPAPAPAPEPTRK